MILDISDLISGKDEFFCGKYILDFSCVEIEGTYPFIDLVNVSVSIQPMEHSLHEFTLECNVEFTFCNACDRCNEPVVRKYFYRFFHILVPEIKENELEHYIDVSQGKIDLFDLVYSDILLELPMKFLCKESCLGLCPVCGKNLNKESCNCMKSVGDSRFQILKKLME